MFKAIKFFLLPIIAILATTVACNKSDELSADEFVDQALYSAQERGGLGRFGCYELVFPVNIVLPDGSSVEVYSYDDIKLALRNYFQNNSGQRPKKVRPHLSFEFPISVLSQDGELITLNSQDELLELRRACAGATFGNHDPRGHGDRRLTCFEVVFPITIEFPDGTTVEVSSRQEMRQAVRQWHSNNPGQPARPKIVFPLTVKMTEDGALVTVNSPEELRQLKADCN
jgi:hypothetical protein